MAMANPRVGWIESTRSHRRESSSSWSSLSLLILLPSPEKSCSTPLLSCTILSLSLSLSLLLLHHLYDFIVCSPRLFFASLMCSAVGNRQISPAPVTCRHEKARWDDVVVVVDDDDGDGDGDGDDDGECAEMGVAVE